MAKAIKDMSVDELVLENRRLGAEQDAIRELRLILAAELRQRLAPKQDGKASVELPAVGVTPAG